MDAGEWRLTRKKWVDVGKMFLNVGETKEKLQSTFNYDTKCDMIDVFRLICWFGRMIEAY